ncbi:hypothetical protein [Mesorhizobium amorphae]|uniref:Beta-lactamase n=1 Tax=Mesorhizobium amorphae CCNWGS0123 TaxID=1082933 RepID=G6YGV9_9HYPH|nr:hypothetical protein [Mesorhizobium amorphae]ANT52464.1 hypothetical protein A6B35_22525 [Mesorhizobium amorphae CCNWGS0123]EHH08489.1 hypothetical protein MEA186_26099 [Mesorhizobium amorphae CCNWGS0123]GLR43806.1 hypothetical protein GCM10007880_43230 [Mesorhizobium amorphae]
MMRAAAVMAGAAAIVVSVTLAAAGQQPAFDKSVLPKLFAEIERRVTPSYYFQQCPADIWREAVSIGDALFSPPTINYENCARDVLACAKLCFEGRSGEACFETARVIQENTPEDQQSKTQAMFAQACATGSAGGCTNRGAGILHDRLVPDKLRADGDAEKACTYRTFKLSCDESDAWGCTMYGIVLQQGEGVSEDEAGAIAAYKKSCGIAADFDACQYAKALMKTLESR